MWIMISFDICNRYNVVSKDTIASIDEPKIRIP